MRNYILKRTSGAPLLSLPKLYDIPVDFESLPSFKAVYCYICGCRRVAVARYRMICLVLLSRKTGFIVVFAPKQIGYIVIFAPDNWLYGNIFTENWLSPKKSFYSRLSMIKLAILGSYNKYCD